MTISILGIDIGKNSCSVVGVDDKGAVTVRRTMRRQTLIDFVSKIPTCIIAMEACCGAHHLGRLFRSQGHEVRLMSPEYVRPYVKAQKNDDRDAEGIAEAASRPTMRFVDLKSEEQLDIQSLHWVRSRLVAERTTLINQMRAILLERGLIFSAGRCKFESAVDSFLNEQASSLSERVQKLVAELRDEWKMLDTKIAALNAEFLALARDDPATRRLTAIPGIGVLNATALIAAIGNASSFDCARDSWRDNVFVERLWRSIKYEEVYLHAYKTVSEARAGIRRYLGFYNTRRPHSSLDRQTPDQAYFNALARTHPSWAALCSE